MLANCRSDVFLTGLRDRGVLAEDSETEEAEGARSGRLWSGCSSAAAHDSALGRIGSARGVSSSATPSL